MTPKAFKDSQEAAMRRMVRTAVRNGPFTRAERDVTLAIVNHWFHHKSGPKGFIHPSREAIAKKAKVCVKTVSRSLDVLRGNTILVPVSGIGGGKAKATRYNVDLHSLMVVCGCVWATEFLRGASANVPVSGAEMSRYGRDKMSHCLNDVASTLRQGWVN